MVHINFDSKASIYEQNALVQKSASAVLLGLMAIQEDEDVLDGVRKLVAQQKKLPFSQRVW